VMKFQRYETIGEVSCCDAWMAERIPLMDRSCVIVVEVVVVVEVYLKL